MCATNGECVCVAARIHEPKPMNGHARLDVASDKERERERCCDKQTALMSIDSDIRQKLILKALE